MSDRILFSESTLHGNSQTEHSSSNLFDSAYSLGTNLVREVNAGGGPIVKGFEKRIEECPGEVALEGLGIVAAGGMALAAIPAEATMAGLLGAASVTTICGVGLYEGLKQIDRLGKEWTADGKKPFSFEKVFRSYPYSK